MKLLVVSHSMLLLVATATLAALTPLEVWASFLFGGATSLLNTLSLVTVWPRLLAKKQVALAIVVIVFKFAILGWILYLAVHSNFIRIGWFAVGLGIVVPSVLVTAIRAK